MPLKSFSSFNTIAYDKANDFYDVLGVKQSDDAKKIKIEYYKLAQKYHPDKQKDNDDSAAEEKFKKVNNAYEVLKDESSKKQYDALRMESKNPTHGRKQRDSTYAGGWNAQGPDTGGYDPFASASNQQRRQQQREQNGNFYGDFKTRDDFYKHYTGFDTKDAKNAWNKAQGQKGQSRKEYDQQQNFYRTRTTGKKQNKADDDSKYRTNAAGDTQEEAEWRGGYTQEEEDFYKKHFDGDMFGFKKGTKWSQEGQRARSASDPTSEHYDKDSIFNKFKEQRKNMYKKEKKVYQKFEPGEDSAFKESNRGFQAQPDRFGGTGWKAYFATRAHNPFRIRDYKNFGMVSNKHIETSFESAKKWFDSQTHESMTRGTMQDKDVWKMIPKKTVVFIFTFLFGTNKVVYSVVK